MVFRWKRDDGACKDKRDREKGNTHTPEIRETNDSTAPRFDGVCLSVKRE